MIFDLDIIKEFYNNLPNKINSTRNLLGRALTLTEKILYSHLDNIDIAYLSGVDYADFYPDRVAMQDATAQMALLQFIMANKDKVRKSVTQVDDFSGMPDADQSTTPSQQDWMKFRQASFAVNRGIISVPPGTKTTASWPKNPNR